MASAIRASRRLLLSGGGAVSLAPRAVAQPWPERPLRALVGFPPGTPPDLAIRLLAGPVGERLQQPVIIENRSGASGLIAAEALARAPADGHTWLIMPIGTPMQLAMRRAPPVDATELLPVAGIAQAPMVLLASPTLGVTDLAGFLALARARGERLSAGTSGTISAPGRAMALLAEASGIAPTTVSYRGDADIATALLSHQLDAGFVFLGSALEPARDGRLRALAITAPVRVALLPNLPTTAELGLPEVDVGGAWAVVVSRRTPDAVQARIAEAVRAARGTAAYRERLASAGALPLDLDGEALRDAFARDRDRQVALLRRLGVEPE